MFNIERPRQKVKTHPVSTVEPQLALEQNRAESVAPRLRRFMDSDTRKARTKRAKGMRRLRELEDLGYALGIMNGQRMPGRKSK